MIYVAIPTKGRAGQVTTLGLLQGLAGIETTLFVEPDEEKSYEAAEGRLYSCGVVTIPEGGKGMAYVRNRILEAYPEGSHVVMLDDDIESFLRLSMTTGLKDITGQAIVTQWEQAFKKTEGEGKKLWGVYPISNPFYMKAGQVKRDGFIIGTVMGVIVNSLRFDEQLRLKSDYDYTLQNMETYGGVLRFEYLTVEAKHYGNPGGCNSYRNETVNAEMVKILMKKWGGMIRENPRRKGEILITGRIRKRRDSTEKK